jgi:hypothetical protein
MTTENAIRYIQDLFPPDSQYNDTAEIGKALLYEVASYSVSRKSWRELPELQLIELAFANLEQAGEVKLIERERANYYTGITCEG